MKYAEQLPTHTSEEHNPAAHDGHGGGHGWMMMRGMNHSGSGK